MQGREMRINVSGTMDIRFYLNLRVFAVVVALLLAGCAGTRETTNGDEEAEELPTPAVNMADYEDFEDDPYREPAPNTEVELEHDVPSGLMEGRADEGIRSEVRGFRVQVYLSLDKDAALQQEEAVKAWWEAEGTEEGELATYIVYSQPYYRVRVGNFTSQEAAQRALSIISQRFPEALIVPDTVTITR